jgi:anaerobic magnesium-protoporphyrin IX monomethyl ester cyclase
VWVAAHGYFSLNMAASRGCSFRCNWCAKPIWGNRYLQRRAADVAAEMLQLKMQYAPDHVEPAAAACRSRFSFAPTS